MMHEVVRPADEQARGAVYVTGAAKGIGRAIAELLAGGGTPVALLDRDEVAVDAAGEALRASGRTASAHACDVADEASVQTAFAAAAEAVGPPAGLVCSAGIDRAGLAHELAADAFDQVVAVNLRGTFLACRAALPAMMAAGRGSIVCLSSPLGFVGVPGGTGAYSASK